MEKNKPIFTKFISIYRQNPCLWDPKHPNYKNQQSKQEAYEKLLTVMKKFDPTNPENNCEAVRKKINSMRASFRRDYRKIVETGSSYTPNLWYFDQLLFVKNYCSKDDLKESFVKQRKKELNGQETEFTFLEVSATPNRKYDMKESFSNKTKGDEDMQETEFTYLEVTNSSDIEDEEMYEANEVEEHLEETLYRNGDTEVTEVHIEPDPVAEEKVDKEDECTTFGKHIAFELQLMSERQKIIAKKLLSDIAYYGRLERLTELTEISCTKRPGAKEK